MIFKQLYHYKANVISVYDGDTITVNIDLGMNVWANKEKIRFARIDAPEIRGKSREKGLKSRDYLRELLLNKKVILQTIKDRKEKYGRYLAEVWLEISDNNFVNVNDLLVEKNFAIFRKY
ncbi:MAG: thermonuclease family protein [Bacteroidota bacterium]